MASSRDGQPFLVSGKPQRELASKYRSAANTGLFLFVLFGGYTIYLVHLVQLAL